MAINENIAINTGTNGIDWLILALTTDTQFFNTVNPLFNETTSQPLRKHLAIDLQ
jgi:hypothetical protein